MGVLLWIVATTKERKYMEFTLRLGPNISRIGIKPVVITCQKRSNETN